MTTRIKELGLGELRLTGNAQKVLAARYLRKNEQGEPIESPEELFLRVAQSIAAMESRYGGNDLVVDDYTRKFYDFMADGRFMPNSPTLMNAGREMGMLSACFVLPLEDSIDDIFSTVKATAMIQKAGGGTGFSFDKLRPTGDFIRSSGGTTSGPISFWKVLSETTNAIQQGAFRRGANMGMMTITHPDIVTFVHAKQDLSAFNNFNISIKIPDAWMSAYRANPDSAHVVRNARTGVEYAIPKSVVPGNYDISALLEISAYEALPVSTRPVVWTRREIYDVIVDCAWRTGEPGLIFIDAINKANPTPHIGEIEATNPCGEQPLLPYEACNLGSINVAWFVQSDAQGKPVFDWSGFAENIHLATRFLDNVIDANRYPLPEIEQMCLGNRKIGLGVMGFADALYLMGIPYDSEAGIAFGEQVMQCINDESHNESERLAAERGAFPNWQGSVWQTKYSRPMRNSATTTVAPTGTISILANCSGGIEPLFSLAFFRNVLGGQRLVEINPIFEKLAKERGLQGDIFERLAAEGSLAHLEGVPDEVKRIFVCAHDVAPEWHVRMQGAFQKHCDSSISKTINLPHDAERAEVERIYTLAWELGCKGVTVYRDGCRNNQPMVLTKKEEKPAEVVAMPAKRTPAEFKVRRPARTPSMLPAVRMRQNTPFGHMHIAITVDPSQNRELEVFAQLGKAGDVAASDLEAISRLVSLYLRLGGSMNDLVDQLEGIGSHMSIPTKDGRVMSLADGLGKTLHRYQVAKETYGIGAILMGEINFDKLPGLKVLESAASPAAPSENPLANANLFKVKCPECGNVLSFSEGCVKCPSCGFSKC